MKALVGAFNQEKALVGAFSVIVQLHRLIDLRHYLKAGERCWAGLGWLWRTNLDWAGTHVSTKLTKSFHRSIPDRFLMSAAERSKKFALCSRWEAGTARLGWVAVTISGNEPVKMVM